MKTTEHCSGCRNNFYNGNNSLGVSRCWSLESAKLVTKYRIGRDTPMNIREAYVKVKVPSCYHSWYAFLDRIPDYTQSREAREYEKEIEALRDAVIPSGEVGPFSQPAILGKDLLFT